MRTVEAVDDWCKSARSGINGCVEVRRVKKTEGSQVETLVQVRDSKNKDVGMLMLNQQEWCEFLTQIDEFSFEKL